MKIKVKELNPNPFKKEINKGKLNKEIVKKIKANIKELGLMGSLPVFKKDNKFYLVAGHHRLEALRQTFGKDYKVEVTIHNFNDENILRGMVVENLTQRSDELLEVTENLNAIRKFLRSGVQQMNAGKQKRDNKGRFLEELGSIRDIYKWLSKNGEVMSVGKIQEYLKVYDNLDRSILEETKKVDGGTKEDKEISIEEAKILSRIDKKVQKKMMKILDKTGKDYKQKGKLVTEFLNSDKKMQKKVLKKEIKIEDLPIEKLKQEIKKKAEEQKESNKGKIIVKHYKSYQRDAGNKIAETNEKIFKTCAFFDILNKEGILKELDWNTMYKIIEAGQEGGKRYTKFMDIIINKL